MWGVNLMRALPNLCGSEQHITHTHKWMETFTSQWFPQWLGFVAPYWLQWINTIPVCTVLYRRLTLLLSSVFRQESHFFQQPQRFQAGVVLRLDLSTTQILMWLYQHVSYLCQGVLKHFVLCDPASQPWQRSVCAETEATFVLACAFRGRT